MVQMLKKQSVKLGKLIKRTMQLRGGGSALPGLVVEKLHPHFLHDALSGLPHGVVLVSGTNGKTTTTKIIVQLLRASGMKVFTNPSGSNFTRGVVASLLSHVDDNGMLDADIAVLELDEAHAVHFARQVQPRFTLVLNVLRDQLDRFGEIDHTAKLLGDVVENTTEGVVLNRDDELVSALSARVGTEQKLRYFGASDELQHFFPSDAALHGSDAKKDKKSALRSGDVILSSLTGTTAVFQFGKKACEPVTLKLDGIYNVLNAAAALAVVRLIQDASIDTGSLLKELESVKPAFGRGEAITIDGEPLEIVLVKNPSGFRLSLASYADRPAATMIAINDLYADGRDMSWLWDVDFRDFKKTGIQFVSGIRAYDMALRLQYDEVDVGRIIPNIADALRCFLNETTGPRRIYCTYTAMLAFRRELARTYDVEPIE